MTIEFIRRSRPVIAPFIALVVLVTLTAVSAESTATYDRSTTGAGMLREVLEAINPFSAADTKGKEKRANQRALNIYGIVISVGCIVYAFLVLFFSVLYVTLLPLMYR